MALALATAAWSGVRGARDRWIDGVVLLAMGALELGLLGYVALAAVASGRGDGVADPAVFWSYAGASVVLPVAGAFLALSERTRWGAVLAAVTCVVVAVVVLRMHQVWVSG